MKPTRRALPAPTEDYEQRMLAQYLDARGFFWFHVPNGGHRHPAVGAKLKAQGVKRGIADNWIIEQPPGLHGVFGLIIELKRRDGSPSDVSAEQRDCMERAQRRGMRAHAAFGFDEARKRVEELYPPGWVPPDAFGTGRTA